MLSMKNLDYKHQGFKDFGDPLTAEQLIRIEDGLIDHQEALTTCISTQPTSSWVDITSDQYTTVSSYY